MTQPTAREAAGVLAQCKWLKDHIKRVEDEAKAILLKEVTANERKTALLPDGTELGSVSVVEGARSMSIDNPEGFLVWVKQRYPTEVVETVRDSFVKVCTEKVKSLGGLPDANGELCPHVSLARNAEYTKVTLNKLADGLMGAMLHKVKVPELFTYQQVPAVELTAITHADNPIFPPVPESQQSCMSCGASPRDIRVAHGVCDDCVNDPPVGDEPPQDVTELSHNDSVVEPEPAVDNSDPEPFIEEGPPYWRESNTFETTDAVRKRR